MAPGRGPDGESARVNSREFDMSLRAPHAVGPGAQSKRGGEEAGLCGFRRPVAR